MLDGLLLRLILRIQNVFVRCILFTYIVCHSITASAVKSFSIICMKVFKTKLQRNANKNFNHLFVFSRAVNTYYKRIAGLLHMRSNSKSPSFWLKMQVIEVIIHEYAHEMDYAHIKLDLIYQELPVKDWHLWQGFSWKNAKLVVYVALTLFSDLRSGSWQGHWATDHLMFSVSHKLYMDGMLLVRGMVRRMGIMNPS